MTRTFPGYGFNYASADKLPHCRIDKTTGLRPAMTLDWVARLDQEERV
jgi:hypothetical protein